MNKLTCITIDVSQGKSHIQGFIALDKPLGKPKIMRHTNQGYEHIINLKEIIESKTGTSPVVVFEYTGIYHKSLEKFLLNSGIHYHVVAPLRAAKARNNEIRNQKTDPRDCLSLAKMFYSDNLGKFYGENKFYSQLRKLNRYYETNMMHLIKVKVNFRETLAVIYPNYKDLFESVYSSDSLTFLKIYPHPSLLISQKRTEVNETLCDKWIHTEKWSLRKIDEIYHFIKETVPGCEIDDPEVIILLSYIEQIEYYLNQLDKTFKLMTSIAKNTPLFNLVHSLPGIQDNLTSRFIAELGDINRFDGYKSMIAYVGIDPVIRHSGDKDGLHLKISKKGNKRLRTILYLMVDSMRKSNREHNAVQYYYKKKTQQIRPLKPKAASIACASKLVRIIYYMHKTGSLYTYQRV
ncbi:MAG: IS110 family transposase [Syntrophomonadaceae bacterium]|nr:IS110 family transposase [Syntrophomonadaceae bacterium]